MFMFVHPLIHPLQLTITKKAQNIHRSQLEKLLQNPNIAQTPHTRSQYPPTTPFLLLKPNPHQMCTVSVVLSCRLLIAVCSTGIAILFPLLPPPPLIRSQQFYSANIYLLFI